MTLFFDFLADGTITQVFCFFYLSYIWEWDFPVSNLSLRGVAHEGHWWLASARASIALEMQSSFLAPGIPWDTGLTKEGRRRRGKSQGCAGTSTMSCFCKAQSLCHCRLGRAGTRVMGASVAGGMGSQAPVPLLPHYLFPWTLLWLSGWSCVCHLSCCSGCSVVLGSIAMVRGLWVQTLSLLFPQFHLLYVFLSMNYVTNNLK